MLRVEQRGGVQGFMDEYDVTVEEARLIDSIATGFPTVALVFLPHVICFLGDRVVGKLYSRISNIHSLVGVRRAELRDVLGMGISDQSFTDKELRSMIGRRLRVGVETVEFQDTLHLRVTTFLSYSGAEDNSNYSDNEYVFMMRKLL